MEVVVAFARKAGSMRLLEKVQGGFKMHSFCVMTLHAMPHAIDDAVCPATAVHQQAGRQPAEAHG